MFIHTKIIYMNCLLCACRNTFKYNFNRVLTAKCIQMYLLNIIIIFEIPKIIFNIIGYVWERFTLEKFSFAVLLRHYIYV